jgi:hypothetical protein
MLGRRSRASDIRTESLPFKDATGGPSCDMLNGGNAPLSFPVSSSVVLTMLDGGAFNEETDGLIAKPPGRLSGCECSFDIARGVSGGVFFRRVPLPAISVSAVKFLEDFDMGAFPCSNKGTSGRDDISKASERDGLDK